MSGAGSCQFHKTEGPDPSGPLYFLPLGMKLAAARRLGLIATERWRACYEMPEAIVGPDPDLCAKSIRLIEADVKDQARRVGAPRLTVGFSMGTVPATLIAKQFGNRLWSFASADRGDLMIWTSRKSRQVRMQAERRGYRMQDFARALDDLNPIDGVDHLHPDSRFVFGLFDRYIPLARQYGLFARASRRIARERLLVLPVGHVGVILASSALQRRWFAAASRG